MVTKITICKKKVVRHKINNKCFSDWEIDGRRTLCKLYNVESGQRGCGEIYTETCHMAYIWPVRVREFYWTLAHPYLNNSLMLLIQETHIKATINIIFLLLNWNKKWEYQVQLKTWWYEYSHTPLVKLYIG